MKSPHELREDIIKLAEETGHNHVAPALSCVEIINSVFNVMNLDDRFILSKGHACLTLYAALKDKGLNPNTTCGHPDIDKVNGIECTTGSLGHGLPIGVGMAFAKKFKKEKGQVYVVMGDGECQEGTTWESLLIASHYKLNNLTVIVDKNSLQALDFVNNILSLDNLKRKFKSFNCNCIELLDGHDLKSLSYAIKLQSPIHPKVIIANTIKGKGVPIAENRPEWHAKMPKMEDLI
jgi:transketolase